MKTLIVEDDFVSRVLLQKYLAELGDSHLAVNGREAVDAVQIALEADEPYDLICLDIMMPTMDGHQALREIRKLEADNGIISSHGAKIVMTTALGDVRNVAAAFNELCDAYITKPVNRDELMEQLRLLAVHQ